MVRPLTKNLQAILHCTMNGYRQVQQVLLPYLKKTTYFTISTHSFFYQIISYRPDSHEQRWSSFKECLLLLFPLYSREVESSCSEVKTSCALLVVFFLLINFWNIRKRYFKYPFVKQKLASSLFFPRVLNRNSEFRLSEKQARLFSLTLFLLSIYIQKLIQMCELNVKRVCKTKFSKFLLYSFGFLPNQRLKYFFMYLFSRFIYYHKFFDNPDWGRGDIIKIIEPSFL